MRKLEAKDDNILIGLDSDVTEWYARGNLARSVFDNQGMKLNGLLDILEPIEINHLSHRALGNEFIHCHTSNYPSLLE